MKETFFSFLIGKTIYHRDSFYSGSTEFQISSVEDCEDSIRVRPQREGHWGIFIPKKHLGEILTSGNYSYSYIIEGCSCREEWIMSDK